MMKPAQLATEEVPENSEIMTFVDGRANYIALCQPIRCQDTSLLVHSDDTKVPINGRANKSWKFLCCTQKAIKDQYS